MNKKIKYILCLLILSSSAAEAMKYHDNDFPFKPFKNLAFFVSDHRVTDGQDPDEEVRNGMVISSIEGLVRFRLGLDNSADVASWLVKTINSGNTVNKEIPKSLGFAIKGNLRFPYRGANITLKDIYFARKNNGDKYVGGSSCKEVGDKADRIVCEYFDSDDLASSYSKYIQINDQPKRYGVPERAVCFYNSSNKDLNIEFIIEDFNYNFNLKPISSSCIPVGETDDQANNSGIYSDLNITNISIDGQTMEDVPISRDDRKGEDLYDVGNSSLLLKRGGNIDNFIYFDGKIGLSDEDGNHGIKNISAQFKYDTANWMARIIDDTALNKIVIPASHDTGMSIAQNCSLPSNSHGAITQEGNINYQLDAGARYFDIRLYTDDGRFKTNHRSEHLDKEMGCFGEDVSGFPEGEGQILKRVKVFLEEHNSEVVFLDLSGIEDNIEDISMFLSQAVDVFGEDMIFHTDDNNIVLKLANTKLKDIRGKVVFLLDYDSIIFDPDNTDSNAKYLQQKVSMPETADNTEIENDMLNKNFGHIGGYTKTRYIDDMFEDQFDKIDKYSQLGGIYFYSTSWTLTPPDHEYLDGEADVKKVTNIANAYLPILMAELKRNAIGSKGLPNLVNMNFTNGYINQAVIDVNKDIMTY